MGDFNPPEGEDVPLPHLSLHDFEAAIDDVTDEKGLEIQFDRSGEIEHLIQDSLQSRYLVDDDFHTPLIVAIKPKFLQPKLSDSPYFTREAEMPKTLLECDAL